jgi:TonB-dependent starch-binding outer membrane protein SusC
MSEKKHGTVAMRWLQRGAGIFLMLLLGNLSLLAQNAAITGTVTNEKNQPLEGVSVTVKGTKTATITGTNGRFSVNASANVTLVFSYAGYGEKEVPLENQTALNVQLSQTTQSLDNVVAIGYQRLRRSDVTGAVASVKAGELNLSTPTLGQGLVGKVAGVQVAQVSGAPYSSTKIRVRGIGSVNASSEPLYVIDGYPIGGNISSGPGNGGNGVSGYNPSTSGNDIFINPEDIESIEILKDAASAAIYGSRAAAGVVLITTKRGRQGTGKLEYDYQVGMNQLAKKVDMLDASGFASLFVDGRNGNYKDILTARGITWNDAYYSDNNLTRIAKAGQTRTTCSVCIIQSLYDFANQRIIQPQYNTDWQDALYRNALNQRHNISFSGGSNNTRYLLSAGYQDQDGILKPTYQKRINLRANIDADVTKKLKVGSSVFYTYTDGREVQEGRFNNGPILGALVYMPIFPVYNPDGSLQLGQASAQTDTFTYQFQGIENPVALAERVKINRKGSRAVFNLNGTYEILPGFSGKVNLGGSTYNEKYEYYYPTNLSSGINPAGSTQAIAAANASTQTLDVKDVLAEFTLNYNKQLGKHSFNALAGYTAQQTQTDILAVAATNFSNDLVPEITGGGSVAGNFSRLGATGKNTVTLVSYLARVIYDYNKRYYATASFRRDASSRFGPQNRWGAFPSVSLGWNLSNESFYNDWLGAGSSIKLRASWGLSGNNNIGNYRYEQYRSGAGGAVFGSTVYNATWAGNIADASIGWESTSQFNFGADVSLLKNRLLVIANYYISRSYDLLFDRNLSALSGSPSVLTNLRNSNIQNRGFDLQLDARIISSKDFNLNFSGNINANKNMVKSLGGASEIQVAGAERSYTTHVTREGSGIGMFYGLKVAGMIRAADMDRVNQDLAVYRANGNRFPAGYKVVGFPISTYSSTPLNPGDLYFQDTNGDGIINDADRTIIGTPYPDFTYGLNINMNYKFIDFSASFNGVQGNDVLDGQDYYIRNMEGSGNNYAVVDQRYRNEANPGNGHEYRASRGGTQSNSTRLSNYYLQDGSFFRCTNITLGANLNRIANLKKAGISSLRVYLGVDNAFTITNYLGYNPEVDYNNGSNLSPGVDYGKYPLMRAFNAGVRVQF